MIAEGGDDDHLAAPRRRDIAADNILGPVVPALEDDIRLQRGNEFQRRVLHKHRHAIDQRQAGHDGGPLTIALHRP